MLVLISLGLVACSAPATTDAPSVELWVQVGPDLDRGELEALGLSFAEGSDDDWLLMDGPDGVQRRLRDAGLRWRDATPAAPPSTDAYHDVDETIAALEALADAAPDLVELVEVGRSVEGREIVGLRLSTADAPVATWRLVGAHHGNEWSSAEVALDAADRLVAAYGSDAELTALLDRDEVWVIPHANPDGVARNSRYNANNVDINRNYGYQWRDSEYRSGDAPFSEPEPRALRALHAWMPATAGLTFHSGALNIGWVWNYTTTPSDDDAVVTGLADLYASACTADGFWQTNGAEWYITYGDTTDWAYGTRGVLDYTVEVSEVKTPDDSRLPELLDDHWPGVRAFLLGGHLAAGRVVDAEIGLPLPATVSWPDGGHDQHTGPAGRFAHRSLETTPLSATVSAPGYAPADITLTPDGEVPTISLEPDTVVKLRPDPVALSASATAHFILPVHAAVVSLQRPGEDPVVATSSHGAWTLATAGLAAGPWDLVVDGSVAPRSIFVAEASATARIDEVQADDPTGVRIVGEGFGRGSRAWALSGTTRSPQPVAVGEESAVELVLDLAAWADAAEPVDLVLLTRGEQLAVSDVLGDARTGGTDTGARDSGAADSGAPDGGLADGGAADGGARDGGARDGGARDGGARDGGALDSGAPTGDTGTNGSGAGTESPKAAGCGCAGAGSAPLTALLLGLVPLLSRRRQP